MGIAGKLVEAIQSNHKMSVEDSLCSRFRTPRSECSTCVGFCPVNAIDLSEKGVKVAAGCISCGICLSVCPNGTFRIEEWDDEEIISGIRGRGKVPGVELFRISCERGEAAADLVVPCLSRLTEVLLLEPLRTGASGVLVMQPACEECPSSKAAPHLETVIRRAHDLCGLMGIRPDNILRTRIPLQDSLKTFGKSVSRRGFFQSMRAKTIGMAAAPIPDFESRNDKSKEAFRTAVCLKRENQKRSFLLRCLRDSESWTQSSGCLPIKEVRVSAKDSMIGEVEISSECTACGVCATLCPTGAITRYSTEGCIYLGFRPHLCTNCQVCARTCMPRALRMKDEVFLNLLLEDKEIRIFEGKKKLCSICGTDFVGEGSDICPLCKNIHKKQTLVLQI